MRRLLRVLPIFRRGLDDGSAVTTPTGRQALGEQSARTAMTSPTRPMIRRLVDVPSMLCRQECRQDHASMGFMGRQSAIAPVGDRRSAIGNR
jgi:hypothetical protein